METDATTHVDSRLVMDGSAMGANPLIRTAGDGISPLVFEAYSDGGRLNAQANAKRLVAAWNLCHGADQAQIQAAAEAGLPSLLGRTEPAQEQWHLFRIEAEDVDGSHTYFVSAQSGSKAKAQELAEAAVLDDAGTDDEPAELGEVTELGLADTDIFEKVGPH